MHWNAVINLVIVAVDTLLKPLVADTANPIDDAGVQGLLAILRHWQGKGE